MNENLQNEDAEKWKFVIKMEIYNKFFAEFFTEFLFFSFTFFLVSN